MKKNGNQVPIAEPQTATSFEVKGLEADKKYVFRLAAKNKSGISIGTVLGPITTVEFAPEQADKSGWMTCMPKMDGKKTLSRRLSMTKPKNQGKKYWCVPPALLLAVLRASRPAACSPAAGLSVQRRPRAAHRRLRAAQGSVQCGASCSAGLRAAQGSVQR